MSKIEGDPFIYGMRKDLPPQNIKEKKREKNGVRFNELLHTDLESSEISEAKLQDDKVFPQQIHKLIDQIFSYGEELARHPSPENIKMYKKILKQFLQNFIDNGIIMEKQLSGRSVLNQKSFQLIKVVDEKLEKLVVEILQNQINQIQILSRVEEIQGLLVNILS